MRGWTFKRVRYDIKYIKNTALAPRILHSLLECQAVFAIVQLPAIFGGGICELLRLETAFMVIGVGVTAVLRIADV